MEKAGREKVFYFKHIVGLERPNSGLIYLNGDIIDSEEKLKSYKIAFVFQSSALFNSLTVGENVALYLKEHRVFNDRIKLEKIVTTALSIVGLQGKENQYPSELSGGMKRRVATARALVMNPDLILFDEPTTGLDPMMTTTVGDLILSLKDNVEVTQIVVTHDIELAFYIADRIAILSDGKILQVGNRDEILNSNDPIVKNFISPKI